VACFLSLAMRIRPYHPEDADAIVRLSLRAWAPVFASLEQVLPAEVYHTFYPDGWQVSQQKAVETVCADTDQHVWVAEKDGASVGFVAVRLHAEHAMGEIYMVAVAPEHQRSGIGGALMEFALERMRDAGMTVAMVETGGDPGHAPARRAYERAGFHPLALVRYFRKL
jgi:GNAT superfamily N-acetyltransferase